MTEPDPSGKEPTVGYAGLRRGTLVVLVLFWIAQYSALTVLRWLLDTHDTPTFLLGRAFATGVGLLISLAMARAYALLEGARFSTRILVSIGMTIAAAMVHALCNWFIFAALFGVERMKMTPATDYAMSMLSWFWNYAALAGLLLAVTYNRELADRERRLAALERLAHSAQLRALRYQLNPHFMFNALNSIAALISKRDNACAERAVEGLANFFRASLAINPLEEIPFEDELELQKLYLNIEKLRFRERLNLTIEVSPEASGALVPSFMLQPLTENVVRHAVSNSDEPIDLAIRASADREWLRISVVNSGGSSSLAAKPGTSVGLKNVEERLRARFGERHRFSAAPTEDGGFAVQIVLPHMSDAQG